MILATPTTQRGIEDRILEMKDDSTSFAFVHYDGPKLPKDPAVRRRIRQRAMRDIAIARRQRGDHGKHNQRGRSTPGYVESADTDADSPPSGASEVLQSRDQGHIAKTHVPRWPRYLTDMFMTPDSVTLLQLTPLTGLRLGFDTYSHLHAKEAEAPPVYGADVWSSSFLGSRKLLSFIPSRYGHVASLRHATDCVVVKVRQMLTHPDRRRHGDEAIVLKHYGRALRSLQADLSDETRWMAPETLCAAELLGAFEMLNGSNVPANARMPHVRGAARLIEARGPHRFNTEFEIALLLEHIGPSIMEAFSANTPCFLAEKKWLRVLRTAIRNAEFSADQQSWALALWEGLVIGPRAFRETTDIILSEAPVERKRLNRVVDLMLFARERLLRGLVQSHPKSSSSADHELLDGLALALPMGEQRASGHLALQGACLLSSMLKARSLYALAPARFYHLEMECQELAGRIMALRERTDDEDAGAVWSLFISQCNWVAKGVLETKDTWSDGCQYREGVMIEKWKFREWCLSIQVGSVLRTA